jgi:8-amino-7-oxononanoate synthase
MTLDFTSALYLGFRHAHGALPPWAQLTTGRPAALERMPEAERVAAALAQLMRFERAALAPSTLHLYWDLFDLLARDGIAIYADASGYPIARWGIERVAAKGVRTTTFPAHDAAALEDLLHRGRHGGCRPVLVTDGVCPETGRTAPLPDYLRLVRQWDGYVVVDDTQALGILGEAPARDAPYGRGGAGTPAWYGVEGPGLIVGSSLAKGFGAPLAVIAGDARLIARFEDLSATRVHSSPPSLAAIGAAEQALALNEKQGDLLRARLVNIVQCFREKLRQIGLSALGGLFPVQTLRAIPDIDSRRLYRQLLDCGVKAVLRSAKGIRDAVLTFLITVWHTRSDIDRCMDALQHALVLMRHQHERGNHALWRERSDTFA